MERMIEVPVDQKILSENQRIADGLRAVLSESGTLSLNFIGSPGAGKTAFLERTLQKLAPSTRVGVLTGDLGALRKRVRATSQLRTYHPRS